MRTRWFWLFAGVTLLGLGPSAEATDPQLVPDAAEVRALAARIDHHLAAGWNAAGVKPAPLADDAEFLRRVFLDVAGRIPSVAEARTFRRASRRKTRRPPSRSTLRGACLG